jgi:MHS family citrate/tricarballylate:H+ symporter-like MFS transporter
MLHSVRVVYGVMAILGSLQAFLTAPALVAVTESLPKAVRSGSLAILYAVAISLCGGTTQFALKAITDLTGSALTPAWYMTGAVLLGGVAMALMQETAPLRRRLPAASGDTPLGRNIGEETARPPSAISEGS